MSTGEVEYVREDLTGRWYGRLTVCREIKQAEKSRRHYWLCRCDCGKEKTYSIVPESDQDNEDAWFISGSYEAGADFKLPDTKELISKVKEKEAAGEYDTTEAEEETENAE